MSRQLLFCVEADKKSRTDYQYIEAVIKHFFVEDRKIIYRPIFMGGKAKYTSKTVLNEIAKRKKDFNGITDVIYFIDTDNYNSSQQDRRILDDIRKFCVANAYELVYYTKDVEDVFLGETIENKEKVKRVADFKRKKLINNVPEQRLRAEDIRQHCSNILIVLEKYWKNRKI